MRCGKSFQAVAAVLLNACTACMHLVAFCMRRSFRELDSAKFQTDLQNTDLYQLSNSSIDGNMGADMLFSLYDSTMESLLYKHALRRKLV